MSHKHYCDVAGHEWVCTDITCECICGELMENGDHIECPIELRACPEHHRELPALSDDELSEFVGDLTSNAENLRCECGCADAHPEDVVGYCVWCSHVYVSYSPKTEAQHFLSCPGAPAELRVAAKSRLARLN
jgi:hypothetical protein